MVSIQAYLFMVFTIVGVVIGLLFDFFRISRKTFKTNDIITSIEDVLFWIITGIIIIYSMYVFCNGQLRFFMIIGIIIGNLMYLLTISKYLVKIAALFVEFIKKTIMVSFMALIKILKKLVFTPITIICINLRKNFVKKSKNHRGIFVKKEKYNSI